MIGTRKYRRRANTLGSDFHAARFHIPPIHILKLGKCPVESKSP